MTWTCPNCLKEFKNSNQYHSCARVELGDHFKNKAPFVREIFDRIMAGVEPFGDVVLNPVKTSIEVRAASTFLSVKAKRDCLEIAFQLAGETDEFPVYKTVRLSSNRVLHFAVLEEADDVDDRLLAWLSEAYELSRH